MIHKLKINDPYLKAKLDGDKLFEIRLNDRGYQKGDIVVYKEYKSGGLEHIDHKFEITYVCNYMQKEGYVVFGEKPMCSEENNISPCGFLEAIEEAIGIDHEED